MGNNFSDVAGDSTLQEINDIITNGQEDKIYLMASAPTGSGKSFFIKNKLYNYCKERDYKILYLLPRIPVKDEFRVELTEGNKSDIITIKNYQAFEKSGHIDFTDFFAKFKFVICDECHYFVSDSTFNFFTYRSYTRIIKYAKNAVKFYITATETPIQEILQEELKLLDKQLKFLKLEDVTPITEQPLNVRFFSAYNSKQKKEKIKEMLDIIDGAETDILNGLPNQDKAIVFCDSVEDAYNLHKQYKDSIFICSKYNKKYAKYIDSVAYNKMLTEHKFDCKYVFCTSALDVGFSIKDKQVKHIICLLWEWNSIVQSIGRKRFIDNTDKMTVWLKDYSNNSIGGLLSSIKNKLKHYYYYQEHGDFEYYKKYEKIPDPARIMYYAIDPKSPEPKSPKFILMIDRFILFNYANAARMLEEINAINSQFKYRDWVRQQLRLPVPKHTKATAKEIANYVIKCAEEKIEFIGNDGRKKFALTIGCNPKYTSVKSINEQLENMKISCEFVKVGQDTETRKQIYQIQKNA